MKKLRVGRIGLTPRDSEILIGLVFKRGMGPVINELQYFTEEYAKILYDRGTKKQRITARKWFRISSELVDLLDRLQKIK